MLLCIRSTHFISVQGHSRKLEERSAAEAAAGGKWWVIKQNKSQGVQLCLIVALPREDATGLVFRCSPINTLICPKWGWDSASQQSKGKIEMSVKNAEAVGMCWHVGINYLHRCWLTNRRRKKILQHWVSFQYLFFYFVFVLELKINTELDLLKNGVRYCSLWPFSHKLDWNWGQN